MTMNRYKVAVLAVLVGAGAQPVLAQNYPTRPVRLVSPSSPGGSSDFLGRILAQKLGEQMGQQVVVDNRAGAGGPIGYDLVAKAAPDGYTLLIAPASIAINTSMYSKLPYAMRDFAPISLIVAAPNVLCVHPSVPATSVKALIALARARPGSLVAGSAGIGTSPHLSTELGNRKVGAGRQGRRHQTGMTAYARALLRLPACPKIAALLTTFDVQLDPAPKPLLPPR